jgi:arylsulfatase A-like enzyme
VVEQKKVGTMNHRLRRLLLALLVSVQGIVSSGLAQTQPPNIVIILADDLGYGDVSFNGCLDYTTPNIDSIASNGALCTNGYVTCPFCSPSRAALLTGRYQQRFGYENQPGDDSTNSLLGLPMTELGLWQMLKPAGYVCGAIGKWHLGEAPNLHPLPRGFDEFFGFLEGGSTYWNASLLQGDTPYTEPDYLTDAFTREAVSFINRHAAEPFLLYLAYSAVHGPYDVPPQVYLDQVPSNITDPDRRNYAAMVIALDDGVGQVLQTLQTNNLLDKTVIFFLSDNGAPFHRFTRNAPLRGYKWDVLEGGIRVPFAVQWTGQVPAHVVYDTPISSLDIVPTVAAATGVSLPTDRVYDGLNVLPYLTGQQTSPPRTLFWRWLGFGSDGPPGSNDTLWAVRSDALKLVRPKGPASLPALYNLPSDIGESQDLAPSQPDDVAALTQLYNQWSLDLICPLWRDEYAPDMLPLVLAGDWNGYNKDDPTVPWRLIRITAPSAQGTPDSYNSFSSTIHVATIGGDTTPGTHSFTLVGGRSYATQWGGVTVNVDNTTSIPFFCGTALGPTNSVSLADGFFYSVRLLEWSEQVGNPMNLTIMKTSAPPISVIVAAQTPPLPTAADAVLIEILPSHFKSVEERIYLRWSTDFFITSHLVEASGAGLNYTATIPAQPAGTAVEYAVVTSTVDLSKLVTSGPIDSLTLATSNLSRFVVSGDAPTPTPTPNPTATPTPTPTPVPSPPVITVQPRNKKVIVGKRAKFGVTATGTDPLGYQWRKNSLDINGATQSSYTTPPTIAADNGSLFSVVVNNSAGSVTSRNAKLTVNTPTPTPTPTP